MWKKILLSILALIIIVVGLVLYFTKTIGEIADKQLVALREGDLTTAYSYGSKDFQATTTQEDFKNFVNAYPSLKHNISSLWSSREINHNTGTLTGTLTSTDGTVTPIEYHFIKENGEWKILGLQLHQTGAAHTFSEMNSSNKKSDIAKGEIFKIIISDALNAKGEIEQPKDWISKKSPKIYTSVYILHAKKDLKVTAEMVRIENGAKVGPIIATVTKDGNIIRYFSFTNTEPSWPIGDYKINVYTSNKQISTLDFKIE